MSDEEEPDLSPISDKELRRRTALQAKRLKKLEHERAFFHAMPSPDACDHEWGGWRNFEDGRGGEQVCKKCGMGAMTHALRTGP